MNTDVPILLFVVELVEGVFAFSCWVFGIAVTHIASGVGSIS